MSPDQSVSTRRDVHRDAVTWMALGLVVAAILLFTTQHSVAAKPTHHSFGPTDAPPLSMHPTTTSPATTSPATTTTNVASSTSVSTTTSGTSTAGQPGQISSSTPTTVATHVVDLMMIGKLNYPNDIVSTYHLQTVGGNVSAELTWKGGVTLALSLRCHGEYFHRASTMGLIQMVLVTPRTSCVANVTEGVNTNSPAPYSLDLSYPSATSGN